MKGATPKSNPKPKSVGIWIRVSTEDQAKGESPEHHEKRARFYTQAKGWNVREIYHLEAVSGKAVIAHPEAQRMLQDIKTGRITGLIFSKLARLARNTKELLEFAEIFREYGADLISLDESIDTTTPVGRFFYTLIAAMAQWEREEIAARVAASVPIRAKLGKPLGGSAPFGYQWLDRKLVPDPKEAPIRRTIYDLFLEHRRKKAVARILNDAGHRTRNGSKFTDTTIDRLIRDPSAKGIRRANYTKTTGENKRWVLKPQEEWVLLPCESIVSEDLWERCNAILEDRRRSGKRPSRKPVHLFTGIVHCVCGSKMYVPSSTPKYICYSCRNKIPITDLEAVFHEQLKGFFFSSSEIAGYLEDADKTIKEKQELLQTLEKEQQKTKAEMDKMMRLYLDDKLTPDAIGEQYRPLEERQKQLREEIPQLQGEIDYLKIKYLSSDQILTEAKDLYTRWQDLGFEEKRKVVENITERITVEKDTLTIDLCYLPSSSEMMAERQRDFIPALPFCRVKLKALKPMSSAYPKEINTLGDHLRKKRLDCGLLQKQVAELLGADEDTIIAWEKNKKSPSLPFIPRIIEFVGYTPFPPPQSLQERLKQCRMIHGLSQEQVARMLDLDESTLACVERGENQPSQAMHEKLILFFSSYI